MILVRENILKSDLICLVEGPQKMLSFYVFMFPGACQDFFLLARFGRKTDGHNKHTYIF